MSAPALGAMNFEILRERKPLLIGDGRASGPRPAPAGVAQAWQYMAPPSEQVKAICAPVVEMVSATSGWPSPGGDVRR
jgi:hypothetical protein